EVALFGGEEGYEFYGLLIPEAARQLKPGALLVLELGYHSLPAVQPLFEAGWSNVGVTKDLAGIPPVLSAERTCCDLSWFDRLRMGCPRSRLVVGLCHAGPGPLSRQA